MGEVGAKQVLFCKDKNRFVTASAELGAFFKVGFMYGYNYFYKLSKQ
jgi:hypothetical protein